MQFVAEDDLAVGQFPELVLGVHQNQASLGGHGLAELEELRGVLGARVPVGLGHVALGDDRFGADWLVVDLGLGGGRHQGVDPELRRRRRMMAIRLRGVRDGEKWCYRTI